MAKKKSLGSAAKTSEPVSTVDERPEMPREVVSPPPSRVGDLHTVRFYPNGRVSCWVARGRDLQQVRELDGRTRERWPAIEARLAPDTRFWLNAHGVPRPIPADEVAGFVRTQMGWR